MAGVEEPRPGYRDALGSREFRALFASQAISIAGGSIAAVALTVLVFRRTGSPFLSSLTFALGFLPYVLGGTLLSGLVDRVRPRLLVNICGAGSAALVASMALPGLPVAALLGLLFCVGMLGAVAAGGRGALVRSTVPESAYVPARSSMKIAGQIAQIGGSAAGGALVVATGTSGAILIDAGAGVLAVVLVRLGIGDHATVGAPAAPGLLRDSMRGMSEIFGRPELGRLLLLSWLVSMFSVAPEALAAPYVSSRHGSTALVGWYLAALPVGMVAGDLAGIRFLGPALQRRLIFPAAAAGFVPYLFFALHPSLPVALVLLVVSGAFAMYSLGLDGRVREVTPDRLFPRMMGLNSAGLMASQGLGFALAGAVAEGLGPAGAIGVGGVCGLVVVGILQLRPRSRAGTSVDVPNVSM